MNQDKLQEAQLNQQAITNEHLDALHTLSGELNDKVEKLVAKEVKIPEPIDNSSILKAILEESKKEYKINVKLNIK